MKNKIEYNVEYINTHYALISSFLTKADINILDISYSLNGNQMIIQVVLLEGFSLSHETIQVVKKNLEKFDITIKEIQITKEHFNENRGEWRPKYYQWMNHLLFSKAEAL